MTTGEIHCQPQSRLLHALHPFLIHYDISQIERTLSPRAHSEATYLPQSAEVGYYFGNYGQPE